MTANAKKKIFDFSLLRRIFFFVRPYKSYFYLSLALAIFMAIAAPVRPYLIQLTVNGATGKATQIPDWVKWVLFGNDLSDVSRFIIAVTIFQISFLFVETAIRFLFSYITAWMGQNVVKDLRVTVYKKVLGLNLRQFDQTPIGTLTTRTINDIESINEIFSDGLIPIVADLLTIIITLATMFYMDWKLTLVSLTPFPIMIIATYYFKESVNKSFMQVRNAVAALNAFVQEHITGMQVVQAFAAEDKEAGAFKKINEKHRDANINAIFAYSVFFPVVEVVLAVSMGILVWWIADRTLDAGLLVAFILYLNQIFRPLRVIADKFNVLQMGMIAAERVLKVLDNTDELPPSTPNDFAPKHIKGDISFKEVSFSYTGTQNVLHRINFEVKAGETVALVGHTGSGKTSIISLLNRLYQIQEGEIAIDGVDINRWDTDCLRKGIGVVLQDVFLFSGTVMDNITLRNPEISLAQVEEAAKMIGVHDFIMQLPGGYQYNVMERGSTLSLGQRQLISFIRALLYNPAILILDEATSSIDTESELLIEKAIDTLISGRTSIVIAHRLSTIRKANQIIVLDKGELKEKGSHASLLAAGGFYARLHEMQFEKKKAVLQ
ncbi:MAG TPA: ABC transporter ATP-binding protein [Sediminibacterium sp.]|uniref:ABC transporter ATP-binding protein n=1 Tax=Sediminibacterium sp. TaxID=1917865 RepID=UPI0008B69E9B|nr:ABC transporter ATP-binding protein [Sediminibacterium sp.]OHC86786.1 MAG: antibiotic ABC transporter ATP-binding protein [Sphingobacteriia bacterium RIFOXYC2_FULL_35_18]OHC88355.1 MAG: antibiotic ABC transporter ATP-binding protein [Sphingobacteriia bacterium RIFOXYD2_FULL_35_12]HLD51848.1 ABC transporter ATP-binding protein [Sediminibacterium sp.]